MRNKKGQFVKGFSQPLEYKEINRQKHLGKIPWNKGKKLTKKIREKLRIAHLGKKQSKETIEKRRVVLIGKKRTKEFKDLISKLYTGSGNPMWRGGITDLKRICRREHRSWRKEVFIRDYYTCQKCQTKGRYLEAHHIKPWSLFPNLQYDINNGLTLCKKCHGIETSEERKKYWKNQFAISPIFNQQKAEADHADKPCVS